LHLEQVSASNPASLFVGARLMRHYRFIGEIWNVIFFSEVIMPQFVSQLEMDYPMLLEPIGDCAPYLTMGATCPTPSTQPSLLCSSTSQTWVHCNLLCFIQVYCTIIVNSNALSVMDNYTNAKKEKLLDQLGFELKTLDVCSGFSSSHSFPKFI